MTPSGAEARLRYSEERESERKEGVMVSVNAGINPGSLGHSAAFPWLG